MDPSVLGPLIEGRSAEKAGTWNAGILKQDADQAIMESGAAMEAKRRDISRQMGRQRAAIAQAGGGFGGSASDVGRASMADAELDLLNLQYEGQMRRRGLLAKAGMAMWEGKQAKKASYLKATSALVDRAAQAASFGLGG